MVAVAPHRSQEHPSHICAGDLLLHHFYLFLIQDMRREKIALKLIDHLLGNSGHKLENDGNEYGTFPPHMVEKCLPPSTKWHADRWLWTTVLVAVLIEELKKNNNNFKCTNIA